MKFPRKVKVGPFEYTLKRQRGLSQGAGAAGLTGTDTLTIVVDAQLARDAEREVVFHELLHAAWGCTPLVDMVDDKLSENIVRAMSVQLLQLLKENPDLLAYLGLKLPVEVDFRCRDCGRHEA